MKKITALLLATCLVITPALAEDYDMPSDTEEVPAAVFEETAVPAVADELTVEAPSAILIEKRTGQVLYEKDADEKLEPASVTKVMTILLIAEAIDRGDIGFDDTVTTSAYAAGMGGSQVFLEEGEQMTVREMLKCIVVSSANDAAVAMAEHLAGSEQAFASRMNERAAELGMENTHFTNCTGLLDDAEHRTTARDIAIMARELIGHDWIKEFTTIWMDTIRGGEFGLSNTNKLIRYYPGATGLKTGYTSSAGHCLAATAERDGVEYIAVVLHCPSSAARFESAKALLSFAFANYTVMSALPDSVLPPVPVSLGRTNFVMPVLAQEDSVLIRKSDAGAIEKRVELTESAEAPVAAGDRLGTFSLVKDGETLISVPIVAADSVARLTWWDIFRSLVRTYLAG